MHAERFRHLLSAKPRSLRSISTTPMTMAAIATDANLVRTDERIAPADGVAAVLRYARTHH